MYISEIEIDNFKSFAEKTTIPFLEGFTTVSGPNGSGKSNIIDCILFALGLSSSRTLRAEKLPDLINNLSKRNDASVKITFSDIERKNIIAVARKIKRSSNNYSSTYYLNGKVSTLGEIHDELAKYNISPGCYNVMMQGDVTNIINVTPYERRKILDEIAGVADFDRRIEHAKKELETVEERVDKSNIVLYEIDVRLVQLEQDRDHAIKYQKLKEQKQEFESKLSVVKYFDMKNSLERLHESILDGNKHKKEEQEKLKELNNRLEEIKLKHKEISDLVKAKGEDEQIEIKMQMETFKGVISRKKDSIEHTNKLIQDNLNSIDNSKKSIEKSKEKIEDSSFKIDNIQDEIKIIEQNITKEKEELNRILNEVSSINKTANQHVERRNQLRRQLDTNKDEKNNILTLKLTLDEKVSRYKRDIADSESIILKAQEYKTELSSGKELLETQVIELEKELKDYEIQQKNCLSELDKIKNELSDLQYNVTLAYRKVTQLEANKKAAEDANYGKSIETIMNSGIAGVHAPLAQLGQVDKEYSTALEIAMGGRMRSVVVDNDKVASVAIEVLKSSQAGRATFLPMNKMNPMPRGMKLPNVQGVIDFAINLIDFDGKYESAFYYALGDTIIVEDINVARSLIGKYRMVTLDGSLIEKTGAMTGGSVSRTGLKFAQAENDELQIYKERLKEHEAKSEAMERSKVDCERKLEKNRHEYSRIMTEFSMKKLKLENLLKNLAEAESSINSKQAFIDEHVPKLEEAETELNKVCKKHDNISLSIDKLALEIQNIESVLPKDELTRMTDLTESIEFEIKSNETKLGNSQNSIKGLTMEINFNKEGITAQEERIKKLVQDNIILEKEKAQHKNDIQQTELKLTELDSKIKEIGNELVELQQERDRISEELQNQEKRKAILENKIERLQEQIEAYKSRRKELEPEIGAIREELIQQGYNIADLAKTDISVEEINKSINKLQRQMDDMEPVNMKALAEYDEVQTRMQELKNRIDTLTNEKKQIIERMGNYEDTKRKSFFETFNSVNSNFNEIFEQLSDGVGNIILENPEDPFTGGLTIEVEPRGKKTQRLEAMSGGEKSLTALAFVFALQRYMPAPFYAFDEVDMHLDGINAEKLAQMIKNQSLSTQFIVVSLRKPMIESANRTIGVTQKNNGITKVTGVKLHE